jgi:hypothetical protein
MNTCLQTRTWCTLDTATILPATKCDGVFHDTLWIMKNYRIGIDLRLVEVVSVDSGV